MKFEISRSSGDVPVCDGAILESESEYFSVWTIEISTLEELLELSDSLGNLIISSENYSGGNKPSIEIYDTYRE